MSTPLYIHEITPTVKSTDADGIVTPYLNGRGLLFVL